MAATGANGSMLQDSVQLAAIRGLEPRCCSPCQSAATLPMLVADDGSCRLSTRPRNRVMVQQRHERMCCWVRLPMTLATCAVRLCPIEGVHAGHYDAECSLGSMPQHRSFIRIFMSSKDPLPCCLKNEPDMLSTVRMCPTFILKLGCAMVCADLALSASQRHHASAAAAVL